MQALVIFTFLFFIGFSYSAVAEELGDITIRASSQDLDRSGKLNLNTAADTGSRLGLTPFETPASVDIIDQDDIKSSGAKSITEALDNLPGVISGESPAAPSSLSIRGFTRAQVTVLRDGLWLGNANMIMRPQNTCNLERIELLRGPASGMAGQGAVAGAVNAVIKKAVAQDNYDNEAQLTYGRWDSYQLCGGSGGPLTDTVWYRVDASQYGSDGFVDDMDPESTNATGSLLWKPTNTFSLTVSVDRLKDDLANYWGTPLLPASVGTQPISGIISTASGEVIDERTRDLNYNVSDQHSNSEQTLSKLDMEWSPSDSSSLLLRNTWYFFDAERDWLNAEGYSFNSTTGLIDRTDAFFFVEQDQETWGTRFDATIMNQLFGRENRFVAGLDYQETDFERRRGFRFSPVPGDAVDVFNPVAGVYGPIEPRGFSPTEMDTLGVFLEDSIQMNERLSILAGLRYENLSLKREDFDLRPGMVGVDEGTGFTRTFENVGYRLGSVYSISSSTNIYAQYSNANDPANADLFLVDNSQDIELTNAKQLEIGLKANNINDIEDFNFTLAFFQIERDDVTEVIGIDSAFNVGGRESKGVELALSFSPTKALNIAGNVSYVDAEFTDSVNFITFAGNTPPNVPSWTANSWINYRPIAGMPLDLGVSLRFVGDRFGTNDNTVTLESYTLLNLSTSYKWDKMTVTGRINNATDEDYVAWADVFYLAQPGYANQILLGEPRYYEVTLAYKF
jgi:iron complex outermembrane receptor protein